MPKKTIYIAGPMRNYPEFNFPSFDAAKKRFKDAGWKVVSPADLDRRSGFNEKNAVVDEEFKGMSREFMRRDLNAILDKCDAIALLKGWENSRGVCVELALARFISIPIYDGETCKPFDEETILNEAERITNGPRAADYGHPIINFGRNKLIWNGILMTKLKDGEQITEEDVAMCMAGVKLAREAHRPKRDNRVDIAGYINTLEMVTKWREAKE